MQNWSAPEDAPVRWPTGNTLRWTALRYAPPRHTAGGLTPTPTRTQPLVQDPRPILPLRRRTVETRDTLEGKGPQRRLGRRLEGVAKAVGGGYCRLQMPLRLALGVRRTVAGHGLGALEGGGGFQCIPGRDTDPRAAHGAWAMTTDTTSDSDWGAGPTATRVQQRIPLHRASILV